MVRLTVVTLTTALLFAVASPLVPALPTNLSLTKRDSAASLIFSGAADDDWLPPETPDEDPFLAGHNRSTTLPEGATLIHFKGCKDSDYTIPMFVNKNYPSDRHASPSSTVWVVQHGSGRNFQDYFKSVRDVVGDEGIIIAPNFYASTDSGDWYNPDKDLAWNNNDWSEGDDAVAPAGVSECSSFDVFDSLVAHLRNKFKFPNVEQVFGVGHSAGAAVLARYGMIRPNTNFRWVLANSPAMPYITDARPNSYAGCDNYTWWGYGFGGPMPRYVEERNPGAKQAFLRWIPQDITLMTGDLDTYSRDQTGDQSCPVQAQGGRNRRDRGYAWWAYINLLAGTWTDVSQYYGYDSLKEQITKTIRPYKFGARHCTVPGVKHDNYAMFASDCGRAALIGAAALPPGPGPVRPE